MQEDIWDFDEEAILAAIAKHNAKRVLLQFPDGIKMHAKTLVDKVRNETDVDEVLVWAGSNFGACDLPVEARNVGVDLVIHFGHAQWNYERNVIS
jgi:2-(3-amino-3-carboxypropyl)histidine synthase